MNAFEISSSFIDQLAVLEPTDATLLGVHGHDHEWGDQSPDGVEALASLWSSTRAEVAPHISDPDPWQRHAALVLTAWLDSKIVGYEAGDNYRSVNHTYSTFQVLRDTFDQMDRSTKEAWENICSRLEGFTVERRVPPVTRPWPHRHTPGWMVIRDLGDYSSRRRSRSYAQ